MRYNAASYGVRADRIAAVGGSSGGHLALLLGTMDGTGDAKDKDPVNRESAKVQCVVARSGNADLAKTVQDGRAGAVVSFLGMAPPGGIGMSPENRALDTVEDTTYRGASPIQAMTRLSC